ASRCAIPGPRGRGAAAARVTGARRALLDLAVALAAIAVIAVALEVWTSVFHVPGYLVPAPSSVVARIVADWPMFLREAVITIAEAAGGFAVGTSLAFAIAAAMVRSRALERT